MRKSKQLLTRLERIREERSKRPGSASLWPAPYNEDTAEAGFRFVTECWWTDNEADALIELVPHREFVREFISEWHAAYLQRQPLIIEKSRRIIVSWICRGLETWQMGLRRGAWLIIDQTDLNSAEHLWRIDFALSQLYVRRPDLKLRPHQTFGALAKRQPSHVILANGSTITQSHQHADSAQGKGKTGITLEEISKYKAPSAFWGQALIVTQGTGGGLGGWVCGIANAAPHTDWQAIKEHVKARDFLGLPPLH